MTQLSGVAFTVIHQGNTFVLGQETLEIFKLLVRNAHSTGDMPFVKLGLPGSGVDNQYRGVTRQQVSDHCRFHGIVGAGGAFPFGETVFINLDVGVAEFFRLPGGFVTQLSSGALTIENQQGFLVFRQIAFQFIKFAVRKADGRWNVALVKLGFFGP